jgi:hypothetical protein
MKRLRSKRIDQDTVYWIETPGGGEIAVRTGPGIGCTIETARGSLTTDSGSVYLDRDAADQLVRVLKKLRPDLT